MLYIICPIYIYIYIIIYYIVIVLPADSFVLQSIIQDESMQQLERSGWQIVKPVAHGDERIKSRDVEEM